MRKIPLRRCLVMALGLVVMSVGVLLFKMSGTGNDPCNAFYMAVAGKLRMDFGTVSLIVCLLLFVAEILFGARYIGIGTFCNWLGVGPMSSLLIRMFGRFFPAAPTILTKGVLMVAGMLVLSLSVALYQTADLGISPYDSLALIGSDHLKIPYFWCRLAFDVLFTLAAYLLGGLIGLGTLVCMFGLAPFISLFNPLAKKLCGADRT